MKDAAQPAWIAGASWYYSHIEDAPARPVRVFTASKGAKVTHDHPGTLCLRLEAMGRRMRVLDGTLREIGTIRAEVPGARYVMRHGDQVAWTLSVRSIVRKRWALRLADGDRWTFDTPFFWWQNLSGSIAGTSALVGGVGDTKRFWILWLEEGRDTLPLLAAVAFLHRAWICL